VASCGTVEADHPLRRPAARSTARGMVTPMRNQAPASAVRTARRAVSGVPACGAPVSVSMRPSRL